MLNGTSTILLLAAWYFIRRGKVRQHAYCVTAALATSAAFLASYLYYHIVLHLQTPFAGPHVVKMIYLPLLVTHVILAMVIVPLIVTALVHAARRQWPKHRRITRWAMPLWLYVSVTGVVVYWMLYQLYPSTTR
jgi:uncharacterized membrane protein YozB (DUF420 family)